MDEGLSSQGASLYKIPEVRGQQGLPQGCQVPVLGGWGQGSEHQASHVKQAILKGFRHQTSTTRFAIWKDH